MDLSQTIITIVGVVCSVIFGVLAKKLWEMPIMVESMLSEHQEKIIKRIDRLDSDIEESHKRLDVHDRIASRLHDKEIDSRVIVRTGLYPIYRRES